MSDYKNVAMVNNPLVYWLSLTDGQLIPDPLDSKAVPLRNQTASKSSGSGIRLRLMQVYSCIILVLGCEECDLIPDPWESIRGTP